MQAAGLVTLAPKPLLWANAILGGLIFGAGTVLAGGMHQRVPLQGGRRQPELDRRASDHPRGNRLRRARPAFEDQRKPEIGQIGLLGRRARDPAVADRHPFLGLGRDPLSRDPPGRRRCCVVGNASRPPRRSESGAGRSWLTRPWKPWQAGLAIGVVVAVSLISSAASGRNYPIGVTHGVLNIQELVTDNHLVHVFGPPPPAATKPAATAPAKPAAGSKKITWWLVLVTGGLFFGALAAASLAGRIRLAPKPPGQVVTAAAGGFLVGVGAAMAAGCVVGNILSGWALMSVGMFLFGIAVILANWLVTYFYLMNGTLTDMPGTFRLIFKRRPSGGPS